MLRQQGLPGHQPALCRAAPGGNFNIRTGSKTRYFIPKNRVLESEDSQYHICTSAPHMTIRCFFAPHTEAKAMGSVAGSLER
ncbi:MAG: hypothetical protein E5V21_07080 [Mesorhizobium sp.]|nr:MAG: hypothetical protein E5V21_07080 [Mesorhizobium sp.]